MSSFLQKAEIIRKEQLSKDIFRLTMHAPEIAGEAVPGQFVMVRVQEGFDPLLRRPFSIHQVTTGGRLRILFKVLGKGTGLMATLTPGQQLDMVGPLGHGFAVNKHEPICLIGGGIGIAPLLYLAQNLLQEPRPSEVTVLLGARTKKEVDFLAKDFESLGLSARLATDDGTMGHHGMVTELMEELDKQVSMSVYACGPYQMMRTAAKQCEQNNWKCQVSLETMMACGLAACLGCAAPKKDGSGNVHVCKDGPVFKADEVLWL